MKWRTGQPEKSGLYLATYSKPGRSPELRLLYFRQYRSDNKWGGTYNDEHITAYWDGQLPMPYEYDKELLNEIELKQQEIDLLKKELDKALKTMEGEFV